MMRVLDLTMVQRRDLMVTSPNPGENQDYIVVLEGVITPAWAAHPVRATLRYVADRSVLSLAAYTVYLDSLTGGDWPTLEAVALTMLADVNNELIPRWVQISLVTGPGDRGECHRVTIEDRQPGWDNPAMRLNSD